jgi:hypothetical protein
MLQLLCRSDIERFGKSALSYIVPGNRIRMQVAQGNRGTRKEVREQGRNEDHSGWHNGKDDAWRVGTRKRDTLGVLQRAEAARPRSIRCIKAQLPFSYSSRVLQFGRG